MEKTKQLIKRLEAIAESLSHRPTALALIGLGSSGQELARLDEFSDLDFFVIVSPGSKQTYLENLDWLTDIEPVSYLFRNTADGYKLLFGDDIFCEFAVFEPSELEQVPFSGAKILWSQTHLQEIGRKMVSKFDVPQKQSEYWLLGEALTNLYVGLQRALRGEYLSGWKFIQVYALERLLELASLRESAVDVTGDPFSIERRFEKRFPQLAQKLPKFLPGYANSGPAAEAILSYLESHWEVNPVMASRVRALCARLQDTSRVVE